VTSLPTTPLSFKVDRRAFLLTSAVFAGALRAQDPPANFPTDPRQRLSVSTYPFRSVIKSPRRETSESAGATLALEQFAASIPSRFEVHGIEPWSPHFESTEPEYVHRLRAAFDQAGVHVVDIPVDASVHPCSAAADERERSAESWRQWVDAAVILGSPSIRVHLPEQGDDACIVTALRNLVDYAKPKNIVVNLENDDPKSEDAFHVVKIIEQVNSSFLRALPDFCNSRLVGDEAYTYRALTAMFAHAYNISHVKDEESDEGKVVRVDVARIFAIAKQAGYRGYFSMEWEGQGDPYEGTKRLLQQSMTNLA
jgi:sugar phosphate isomerase/epimerase